MYESLYPATPAVLTSSLVRYEQAPLCPRKFDLYRLADFDDLRLQSGIIFRFGGK